MKNRRDICAATEAGFAEYVGLPGTIKTGCQQSPAYQSKFCYEHSPRVGSMTCTEDEKNVSTPKENIVAFISSKKQTRSATYYQVIYIYVLYTMHACALICNISRNYMSTFLQVAWLGHKQRLTWEPASSPSQSLIDEFECGNYTQEVITTTDASYGVINHTLTVEKHDVTRPPQAKSMETS